MRKFGDVIGAAACVVKDIDSRVAAFCVKEFALAESSQLVPPQTWRVVFWEEPLTVSFWENDVPLDETTNDVRRTICVYSFH